MASLHKLLSEEGFERQITRKPNKKVKFKNGPKQDSVALPIFICHDRRSFEKQPSLRGSSSRKTASERSKPLLSEKAPRKDEPAIDDVAIKAIVSILSGYVGRYSKDTSFRKNVREKCRLCFEKWSRNGSDNEVFAHLETGIETVEDLVQVQEVTKEMDLEALQKTIKIFKFVSSLDTSNSYLHACAHLYLSIVYRIAKTDKISAKHLLQLFSDSPFLARTHLLPELWDHVFLPHLLHLKVWHGRELGFLMSSGYADKYERIRALDEECDYHMDIGTAKFALYYKEWLKVGGQAPTIPSVPFPSKSTYSRSRRKSMDSSHSSSNKSLYSEVFGPVVKGRSMDLDKRNRASGNVWESEVENRVCSGEDEDHINHIEKRDGASRRSSSPSYRAQRPELWPDSRNSDYFRILSCRAESTELMVRGSYMSNNEKIKNENIQPFQLNDITRAIGAICSSESLSDCETAIRTISEAWLYSHGDGIIETSLSQASVIQGIMEVLYVSNDDEILELAISLLAELATKSEQNRQSILNSDPHLDALIRLFRSSSLFLKAASLLYLIKPKTKQMVSIEWIALILRVLEFGDQSQNLFTVKCYPHDAAYYFLNELLTGFDGDKNLENAGQIVSLGGLSVLVRRMDEGDTCEKSKASAILHYCVRADKSCRYYLVKNLKKDTIISLLALGTKANSHEHALALLTELLCLSRRNQITECLIGLKKGWDCLNTMHILLFHLHRARPEERPIIAVILLQLDLMEDPVEYSVYREEAIDAIIRALDRCVFDEKIQELSARALSILGGRFSYIGEPEVERWLLKKAGLDQNVKISLCGKDISVDGQLNLNEDEKTTENWQRKTATVLLTSGNSRLFAALAESIANSIPCLARASLVTVCWISCSLHSLENSDLQLAACSSLVPHLINCLNDNASMDEKIIASFSLYNLTKGTDYFSRLSGLEKEVLGCLRKLSRVTWTAKELISVITSNLSNPF